MSTPEAHTADILTNLGEVLCNRPFSGIQRGDIFRLRNPRGLVSFEGVKVAIEDPVGINVRTSQELMTLEVCDGIYKALGEILGADAICPPYGIVDNIHERIKQLKVLHNAD